MAKESKVAPWIEKHYATLGNLGWQFNWETAGKLSSHVGAYDSHTPQLMQHWQSSGAPVELSIVIVTSKPLLDLPARALGYASSALNLTVALREKYGVNVDTLRVLSPCYSNAYANGGNLEAQLRNAEAVSRLIEDYKKSYLPELDSVLITMDSGRPITQESRDHLNPRITIIENDHEDIVQDMLKAALRHHQNGLGDNHQELSHRALAYLLTHPSAWGYAVEEVLFERNGERRINFMPASELKYLEYMRRLESQAWAPATDKAIATIISSRQTRAPYYGMLDPGPWGSEPTLGDLAEVGGLQTVSGRMGKYTGRIEVAEIVANLNQVKFDTESANSRRKRLGLGVSPSLPELLSIPR